MCKAAVLQKALARSPVRAAMNDMWADSLLQQGFVPRRTAHLAAAAAAAKQGLVHRATARNHTVPARATAVMGLHGDSASEGSGSNSTSSMQR